MSTRNGKPAIFLLVGDGLSAFGTWIDFLAILTLAAYQFHVTPYQMALVSAVGLLPGILAASSIGKLCDRANPKHLLLLSIGFRVVATAGILFCSDFIVFVALVGVRSVFTTVAGPAINVMAMRTIEASERTRFYSLLNVLNSTAKIIAPAMGTVSSSLASETLALLMSATFSAASLVAFAFVRIEPRAAKQPHSRRQERAVSEVPNLLPLVWVAATYAFAVFMVNNLFPLVLQQAGMDKSLLGVLISCSGAGNILCGLWLAKRSAAAQLKGKVAEVIAPALWQSAGFGLIGVVLWAQLHLVTDHATWVLPLVFFAIGTVSARFAIALNVYMSSHYASAIGRVSGVVQAWQSCMIFVAPMMGAVVLDRFGGPALFWFSTGAATISFAVFWLVSAPLRRRLEARFATDEAGSTFRKLA